MTLHTEAEILLEANRCPWKFAPLQGKFRPGSCVPFGLTSSGCRRLMLFCCALSRVQHHARDSESPFRLPLHPASSTVRPVQHHATEESILSGFLYSLSRPTSRHRREYPFRLFIQFVSSNITPGTVSILSDFFYSSFCPATRQRQWVSFPAFSTVRFVRQHA